MPESIGGYKILRELGRGGMGVVYLAHQESLDRQLAIKVIAPQLSRTPEFAQRFLREGKIAASLRHANIVQIFNAASDGEQQYLVMEYIQGSNLQQLLEKKEILPESQALSLIVPLLEALHHAHQKGIVHRDVKPANVLLADDGRVVLTDFSVALLQESARITSTGVTLGTPAYMAPEQFSNALLDGRTDLYAVGLILYELVTGFNPFMADSVAESLKRQLLEDPPRPRSLTPGLSPDVEELIWKSIRKDPDERFGFALEMAEEARRCLALLENRGSPARRAGDTTVRKLAQQAAEEPQAPQDDPAEPLWTRRCWSLLALWLTLSWLGWHSQRWSQEDSESRRAWVMLDTDLRRVDLFDHRGVREIWQAREGREFDPGSHRLRFEARGYQPLEVNLELTPFQVVRLPLAFKLREGKVQVSSSLSDVALTVDGQPVGSLGRTPLSLKLPPGFHEIAASKTDYQPWKAQVEVRENEQSDCRVVLQPVPGQISLTSRPSGVRVQIQDQERGKTPLKLELNPGTYLIKAHRQGYRSWTTSVKLKSGQSWQHEVVLEPEVVQHAPDTSQPPPVPRWSQPAPRLPAPNRPRPSGGWDTI